MMIGYEFKVPYINYYDVQPTQSVYGYNGCELICIIFFKIW